MSPRAYWWCKINRVYHVLWCFMFNSYLVPTCDHSLQLANVANQDMNHLQFHHAKQIRAGFLKWGIQKSPWVSILPQSRVPRWLGKHPNIWMHHATPLHRHNLRRLCCHGCWVLLWNPVCGDEDWERTAGIAGSLWLRGIDDDSYFTIREIFAMEASIDLRWSLVDSGHVASVLCLVVPLAGTLVSDSRLRTVGTELEAEKHKPFWTFWAGCVID